MGRHKISEPRCHQLNLSLTATELNNIEKRATALGMRSVHFARAMVLDERSRPAAHRDNHTGHLDRLIYAQLVRLGNNLNQLVRHLHQTGDPLPLDLEPLLTDIRGIIMKRCGDDH